VSKDTVISSSQDFARFIVIVDLESKKISKLNVPNNNYYEPSWSPDCKYISFNVLDSNNWQVGLINLENSDFRIIKTDSFFGLSGATWTNDSKNIIASSSNLFKFDLEGNIVDTIDLRKKLGNKCDCVVGAKNLYTANSDYLVFDCGMPEGMKNVDGPVIALFAYNFKTNELNRLTPKGMYVQDFDLGRDNKIIFTGSRENDKYSNIYQVNLTNKKIEILIKNGSKPTMSK
jgi:dipeptidyl aminopeptidase/acylaminoacyl peptidase